MKLNGIEVSLQPVNMEQVDGVFIVHDSSSKNVFLFNETSSFVWKIILEHEKTGGDLGTSFIVQKILEACNLSDDRKQEVSRDVEEILQHFFDSGLLHIVSPEK